jgi:hypothetical protein
MSSLLYAIYRVGLELGLGSRSAHVLQAERHVVDELLAVRQRGVPGREALRRVREAVGQPQPAAHDLRAGRGRRSGAAARAAWQARGGARAQSAWKRCVVSRFTGCCRQENNTMVLHVHPPRLAESWLWTKAAAGHVLGTQGGMQGLL